MRVKLLPQKLEENVEDKGIDQMVEDQVAEDQATKVEKDKQTVADMVKNSNRILMSVTSAWSIFPSSLVVEETRLTIIHRQLFSSKVHSVDIKDISNIFVNTGILFAQITIISKTFEKNRVIIVNLWKNEAILIRRIIEGLRMFVRENIDTTVYKKEELIDKLKKLSTTEIVL